MKGFDSLMNIRPFSDLCQEFSNWTKSNNIPFGNSEFNKYIWEIPKSAFSQWQSEMDEFKDSLPPLIYQNYLNQFLPDGSILGISNIALDNSNSVKLFKLSSITKEFSINNLLVSKSVKLPVEPNLITLPNGIQLTISSSIEPGSINISYPVDSVDLMDSSSNTHRGTLVGKGFINMSRNSNMLNSNSLLATIDYQNGILHIIRNNNSNEENFVKCRSMLKELTENSNDNDSNDNDNNDSNSSSDNSNVNIPSFSYMNLSGSFSSLSAPVTLVFEFDCSSQPSINPSEEYLSLINYSSNQEIIINQIKDSISSAINTQQNIINTYTGNFDFQLGTTIVP